MAGVCVCEGGPASNHRLMLFIDPPGTYRITSQTSILKAWVQKNFILCALCREL
jgi:hypothetical protein